MPVILFQGDSITDCGRNLDTIGELGFGYPAYVASKLGMKNPGLYTFHNRGISGNRIVDIYARIKQDVINLKPDYISVLVGVNDVWHELMDQNGVEANKFCRLYQMLISETLQALPHVKMILMEPFVLRGSETDKYYSVLRHEVCVRAEIVSSLAKQYGFPFIELQRDLDIMEKTAPSNYWLKDGVHPSIYFHRHIADKWVNAYKTISMEITE